jgi:uncharacterized membrane protein
LQVVSTKRTRLERAAGALAALGGVVFSLAILALGTETWLCARCASSSPGSDDKIIPVLHFLPAIPWLAYVFGTVFAACGAGLLFKRTVRGASIALGSLLLLSTLILEVPKNAANLGDISLRTGVFEPLALACLAWLLPGRDRMPSWLLHASRYLLALSLIIFGVDHFLALTFIGALIPNWIPWHVFWVAFFGAGFIAAGLSIGLNVLLGWGAASIGSMFAVWVFTLHFPRVLGFYGIPGAPRSPAEWSSLFIAIALWGGLWALAQHDFAFPEGHSLRHGQTST